MIRIALIQPSRSSSDLGMPLGIGYLASFVLSQHNDVDIKVIDTGISSERELNKFMGHEYDVVGLSVTSRTYREAVEISKRFRQKHANVPIIFGGPHVSIMKQEILKDPIIDLAVYGEGELTFNEVVNMLRNHNLVSDMETLGKIQGLIFRGPDGVVVNPPRPLIDDLDVLPFPSFHLFPMKRYEGKLPMITSRGCPFACAFCASSQIWGRKWRTRSPENIIEEIKFIKREYGTYPIDFHDDSFNINLKRANAICDELLSHNMRVPWGIRGFRMDIVNEQIANKMRRAGCTHLATGIESANPQMLKRMGKQETIEEIAAGIKILQSAGINVMGQFMIGNPGETLETVQESIEFAQKHLGKAFFGTAVPFPKTPLWDYVKEHGRFLVEEDCTLFEHTYPRIIFETPEFSAQQRLKAMELVEQAGFPIAGRRKEKKSFVRNLRNRIVFRYLFQFLPAVISVRIYFLLQNFRRRLNSVT